MPTAVAVLMTATFATCVIAYPTMFTVFAPWDDEGFMLISLQSFLEKGALYDQVYAQYGPFFYQIWAGLLSLIGPVTHNTGRVITVLVWIASSLAIGITTYRITKDAVLGVAAQLSAFMVLVVIVREPMHPGGLTTLLLAAVALLSTRARDVAPVAMGLIGAATAALMLVKINVGMFTLSAFLLVAAQCYPPIATRQWLRSAVELAFVALPVVMLGKIHDPSVQGYALHAFVAALALVVIFREGRGLPRRQTKELGAFLLAFAGTFLLVCCGAIAAGTSPHGLYDGVIGQALRHAGVFFVPLTFPLQVFVFDAIGLATAIAHYVNRSNIRMEKWTTAFAILKILVGIGNCINVVGWAFQYMGHNNNAGPFELHPFALTAFAWLIVASRTGTQYDMEWRFPRYLLAALAVVQILHAYPIAGSQIGFAAFLLAPIGLICIRDGFVDLLAANQQRLDRIYFTITHAILVYLTTAGLLLLYLKTVEFQRGMPLELPGSQRIRLDPDRAKLYREISETIKQNCGSFVTQPGMNSFYFWTKIRPPTDQNVTFWSRLLSDTTQERIVMKLEAIDGLCLLRNSSIQQDFWERGQPRLEPPLVRFLSDGFIPVRIFGDYELLKRSIP
jgi:hypothetical protein